MAKTAYCRNCGKEVRDLRQACLECGARPLLGTEYCQACGATTNPRAELCVKCGARLPVASQKSRLAVSILAYFFGVFGVHRFYLGKIGTGVLMLLTFGGLGIWALVDFIMAVAGVMKDRHGYPIRNW